MTDETFVVKAFLVVRADGDLRITRTRNRKLGHDEVAFPIHVTIPMTWGRTLDTTISLTMPGPPEPVVEVGEPE